MGERTDRNERLFGVAGQERLRRIRVALVGVGGIGTHVVQQLSLLGVQALALVDDQLLDETNLNRYVGVGPDDVGKSKVDLGERLAKFIDPMIAIEKAFASLMTPEAFEVVKAADYVFGCVDNESARLVLTELCAAYGRPYIDAATDVIPGTPPEYGGRVCFARDGDGCLVCMGALDLADAREGLEDPKARADRQAIYGVPRGLLGGAGPSVVSINGAVASIAVTEFMVAVTGIRKPHRLLNYYGHRGTMTSSKDDPLSDCYYCKGIHRSGAPAHVERYLKAPMDGQREGGPAGPSSQV